MKAVFDTVILVRSLLDPYGWSGTIVFDRSGAYEAIVAPDIVAEYLEVLRRPALVRKFRAAGTRDLGAVLQFIAKASAVQPLAMVRVCRDPADDKFLAAALAGSARFIVSEDKDLLDLGSYEGIQIVSAGAFLRVLEHESSVD